MGPPELATEELKTACLGILGGLQDEVKALILDALGLDPNDGDWGSQVKKTMLLAWREVLAGHSEEEKPDRGRKRVRAMTNRLRSEQPTQEPAYIGNISPNRTKQRRSSSSPDITYVTAPNWPQG